MYEKFKKQFTRIYKEHKSEGYELQFLAHPIELDFFPRIISSSNLLIKQR